MKKRLIATAAALTLVAGLSFAIDPPVQAAGPAGWPEGRQAQRQEGRPQDGCRDIHSPGTGGGSGAGNRAGRR